MSSILLAATNFFGGEAFEAGTAMLFNMSTAPTGWTKDTTYNNRAFRVITGTIGVGGNRDFTTAFASSMAVNSTTITTSTMGNHNHGRPTNRTDDNQNSGGGSNGGATGLNPNVGTFISDTTGNSGSHDHTLSMQVTYVDTIIASKAA